MRESVTYDKSKAFAVRIVRMCKWLRNEHKDFVISQQCLRSGTSIGANLCEAMHGQSRPDFVAKLHIALKEAFETNYWLELLHETDYLNDSTFESMQGDCEEIIKLLTATINTSKSNQDYENKKT